MIMKNKKYYLLCLLLLGCLLTSCEKVLLDEELPVNGGAKDANVTIRVVELDAAWGNTVSRALTNVSEVCTRLQFVVYQDGKREKYEYQTVDETGFGTFSLKLDEGNYQLFVVANSCKETPSISTTAPLVTFSNPDTSKGTGFTDTFYYYGNLTVDSDGSQVNISMKRATAMFRLVTNDVKPAGIKKFQFWYNGGCKILDGATGFGTKTAEQSVFVTLDDSQTGQPLQFDMYTILPAETGNVSFIVKAFDANDDIKFKKEFNVPMQRNCISRYTGDFFDVDDQNPPDDPDEPKPEEPSSAVVMVDPEWGNIFDYTY